jgi:anti-sigma B factor antagonist
MIAHQLELSLMDLSATTIDGVGIVNLPARFNSTDCPTFQKDLEPLMNERSQFVFDLTHVKTLDSMALGTMVACLKHVRSNGGDLRLCGMSKQIRTLFELVRMHHVFDVFNTRQEALDSYKKQPA